MHVPPYSLHRSSQLVTALGPSPTYRFHGSVGARAAVLGAAVVAHRHGVGPSPDVASPRVCARASAVDGFLDAGLERGSGVGRAPACRALGALGRDVGAAPLVALKVGPRAAARPPPWVQTVGAPRFLATTGGVRYGENTTIAGGNPAWLGCSHALAPAQGTFCVGPLPGPYPQPPAMA